LLCSARETPGHVVEEPDNFRQPERQGAWVLGMGEEAGGHGMEQRHLPSLSHEGIQHVCQTHCH